MAQYNFNTAYTQCRELYGLELKDDQFETLGLIAWDRIGNKQYRFYKYHTSPTKDNNGSYIINLPCNADIIEAVTGNYEDYDKTSNIASFGLTDHGGIEGFIENSKSHTSNFYTSGKFIKYSREGNILRLAGRFNPVNILYKGVIVDEEGLPFLNSKELDAIAAFCVYSSTFKDALVSKDGNTMQMAQLLEQKWKSLCTQARIPEYLNQNDMDEILNVSASWDRKRFGKSFKPIR